MSNFKAQTPTKIKKDKAKAQILTFELYLTFEPWHLDFGFHDHSQPSTETVWEQSHF